MKPDNIIALSVVAITAAFLTYFIIQESETLAETGRVAIAMGGLNVLSAIAGYLAGKGK